MKQSIKKALDKYLNAENKLRKELQQLSNGGDECSCAHPEHTILLINSFGEWPEMEKTCLTCGGIIWDRE